MNKLELTQTGGFPLNTDRLADAQEAWGIFNALGYLGGEKTIISGCVVNGANTGNGYVFFDGEVLPFVGGATMETVKLVVETTSKQFQDGQTRPVLRKRYMTFGSGTGSMPWAGFKRAIPTNTLQALFDVKATNDAVTTLANRVTQLEKYAAPFAVANGSMVFWRKPANTIPAGWQEVTDWRGRLPMGYNPDDADFSPVGKPGGAKTKSLSVAELPAHSHGLDGNILKRKLGASEIADYGNDVPMTTLAQEATAKTADTGNGNAFSLLNPYRVVMYIEPIPQ